MPGIRTFRSRISLSLVCLLAAKGSSNFAPEMLKLLCTNPSVMGEVLDISSKFDPKIQTEEIGFDAAELIDCGGCGRKNPPNRLECIYCGAGLDIDAARDPSVKQNLRRLELWESGHNVIFAGMIDSTAIDTAKIAGFLSIEPSTLAGIVGAGTPLPVARVETGRDAAILQSGLAEMGLDSFVVSDRDLAPEKPPVRLSTIQFLFGCLTVKDFNTAQVTQIDADDLALVVPGLITQSRVDSLEEKGRRGKSKAIDESATISDEIILDLYSRHDAVGFRVHITGFDFSGLDDKDLLAAENIKRLLVRLKQHAPKVKVVSDYKALRGALGHLWEVEIRNNPKGMQTTGFGKRAFASVATSSNLNQFTKYSRLQWRLL